MVVGNLNPNTIMVRYYGNEPHYYIADFSQTAFWSPNMQVFPVIYDCTDFAPPEAALRYFNVLPKDRISQVCTSKMDIWAAGCIF